MIDTDVLIIGAGLLGCFSARELARFQLNITVLEQESDVCCGISKANAGIIYPGYDAFPGSVKARMNLAASREFDLLCSELDVPFRRCGSLMTADGPSGMAVLEKKLRQGVRNGAENLCLMDRDALYALEPGLSGQITGALYSPDTGTVNPWELGIAAFENARSNGVRFRFGERLTALRRDGERFLAETGSERYSAGAVINCAGLSSDAVRELTEVPYIRLFPTEENFLVFDRRCGGLLRHIIFRETESGKGMTFIPTVDGNLLASSNGKAPALRPGATSVEGLEQLLAQCRELLPALHREDVIRSFGAARPNPRYVAYSSGRWVPTDKGINDFSIVEEDGLISLLGIKTPGLTCSRELGREAALRAARHLRCDAENPDFDPVRKGIPRPRSMTPAQWQALIASKPEFGNVVCSCEQVTEGEILEAIRRGAATPDGIKRRTGAGMGRCQFSRCYADVFRALQGDRRE